MTEDIEVVDGEIASDWPQVGRRSALRVAGGAVVGTSVASVAGLSDATAADGSASDPDPEVRFENQESDGTSITVAYAATDVKAFVLIERDEYGDVVGTPSTRINLDPGDTVENVELEPDDGFLSEGDHHLTARLQESNGGTLDTDNATVQVEDAPEVTPGFGVRLVDADPDAGFNYPYFLYGPVRREAKPKAPLLVESNNTGTATDDFDQHLERARGRAEGGAGALAGRIGAPLLVPVFPRPREEPVDWTHYVHQLDDTTMGIDEGSLERVDLQLLRMVDHARAELATEDYPVDDDGIMLNGFSASGNFADRFTVLHPDEVVSVTAGGLNGMAALPVAERDGHELPFHVGVADVEELTGEPFDPDALDDVNQFLYMGAEDDNDTIPFGDAWTDDDLRELALDVYGEDMITERFPTCQEAYREAGIDATFRVYEGTGHTPRPAMDDIVAFHRRSIESDDVDGLGETVVPSITFEVTAAEGLSVEFDAGRSDGGATEVSRYLWEFGNDETAFGEVVTHEFEDGGEYDVALTVVLDDGTEHDATKELAVDADSGVEVLDDDTGDGVADADGGTDVATEDGDDDGAEGGDGADNGDGDGVGSDGADGDEPGDDHGDAGENEPREDDGSDDLGTVDESVPGFGVTGALAGLGGAVYMLRCRVGDAEAEN